MNVTPEATAAGAAAGMSTASAGLLMLPTASLVVDDDLEMRVVRNPDHLNDLIEAYREGCPVPPIVVVHDGSTYRVVDGFYRVKAADVAGRTEIAAEVRIGTKRDAILMACGMNATQLGLPRSRADKRRAVEVLLSDEKWGSWSNAQIAKACAVSAPFVASIRQKLTPNVSSERRFRTKHGTEAKMDVGRIGKRNGSAESAPIPAPTRAGDRGTAPTMPATTGPAPRKKSDHVLEVVASKPETDPVVIARADLMTLLARQPDADLRVVFEFASGGGLHLRLSLISPEARVTTDSDHAEVTA